ncbi:MAG TPA: hypothetical protein PKK05_23315, partial [Leptospiraceae bacterium]|nr:hypothetical protein [Leptospiraceae bacterium]
GGSDVGETVIWSGLKPLFNEYIWWFIGTVLVLAGSVMGIREAWMSLSGMYRHFTVAGGVLLYQTLFCGLGIFLGSKSKATGKILSGISLLLFPVLFSAASDIVSLNFIIGAGAVAVFSAVAVFLLNLISSQFETELKKLILPVLPSGIILAFLPSLGQGYGAAGLFFASLIPVFFLSADLEKSEGKEGKFFLLLGLYGTFSVFTVYTAGPSNGQTAVFPMQKGFILLWILVFCEIIAFRFGNIGKKSDGMNLFFIFEILMLSAVLVVASMSSFEILKTSVFRSNIPNERFILLALPAVSAMIFLHSVRRHISSLHIFMILSVSTCFILGNELLTALSGNVRFQSRDWIFAFSVIVPVSGLFLAERFEEKIERKLQAWGMISGSVIALYLTVWTNQMTSVWTILPAGIFGFYFLAGAHFTGGFKRRASHLAAALGTVCFVSFIISYLNLNNFQSHLGIIFGVTSILYSLSGFYFDSRSEDKEDLSLFRPLDDNSLITAFLSAVFLSNVTGSTGILENSLVLFTGLNLIFRSFRDKSVLISFLGVFILSLSVMRHLFSYFTQQNTADTALIAALTALLLQTGAVIFPNAGKPTPKARKMLTAVRLPFPADGLSLLHFGLSFTSFLYIIFSVFQTVIWFGLSGQPDRNLVIIANTVIALIFFISFTTHSFSVFSLKGSTAALGLIFISVGLAAVANRIGRPLPPPVVGTNLTLGIGALWLFSRLLFHKGPVISAWLENPEQGKTYHFVPLVSMLVISLVLFADIFLIGLPTLPRLLYVTPPTFFLGIALAAFLFGRSFPNRISMHIALLFSLFFISLSFAQSGILGIALYPLDIPGGRWVPSFFQASQALNWLNPAFFLPADLSVPDLFRKAALGISAAGVLYAALSLIAPLSTLADIRKKFIWTEAETLSDFFSGWSVICIMLIAAFSFSYAALPPGVGLAAASVILIVSHRTDMGMVSLALSGLIITEGFAFTGNTFPFWTGPLLAGIGLLLVLSVKQVSEFFKKPFSRVLESSHIGAFIYSGIGILYALAYTMSSDGNNSALSLLSGSAQGLFGGWMLYPVLGITFMLIAASLFVGSVQWKETLSTAASAGGFLFTAVSLLSLFPFGCSSALCTKGTGTMLLEMFPWFSAVTAITAVAAFTASVYSEERRKDFS